MSSIVDLNAQGLTSPTNIPIYNWITYATNGNIYVNLIIYASIGSNTNIYPYVLDTGSAALVTALGTGPGWTGSTYTQVPGPNNTFTDLLDVPFKGNVGTTVVTISGSGTGANSLSETNATLGVITNEPYSNWNQSIDQNSPIAPEPAGTFGTLGAGLYQLKTNNGSMLSVLGQIPINTNAGLDQGYIVHSGGATSTNGILTVGLTQAAINRNPILVKMQTNGVATASTGQTVNLYQEAQLLSTITIVNPQGLVYKMTNLPVIVDSGGQDGGFSTGTVGTGTTTYSIPSAFINSFGNLATGDSFSLTVQGANGAQALDWSFTAGTNNYTNQLSFPNSGNVGSFNTGIMIYHNYDVMFDTTTGLMGFNPLNIELNKTTLVYQGSYLFQGTGSFTNSLGTNIGQIQWTDSGGFSAQGSNLTVNIGGFTNPATLQWGQTNFLSNSQNLYFSSPTSDGTVVFQNGLDLAGSNQTILVTQGISSGTPGANITGNITNGGLIVGDANNTGILLLSGTNTYGGNTTIKGGTLEFSKIISMPASGAVDVQTGATLAVAVGGPGEFSNATTGNGSIGGLLSGLGGQSNSTVTFRSGSSLGLDTTGSGGSVTYAGDIINGGIGLTKLGTGTLILSGANTYNGGTTIIGGILQIANENNLGGSGGVGITLNGGELLTTDASTTLAQNVFLTMIATNTLAAAVNTKATYTGLLADGNSGSGALTVGDDTNTGTVILAHDKILSHANTYSGGTTIQGGILEIASEKEIGGSGGGGITLNGGELLTTDTTTTITQNVTLVMGTINTLAAASNTTATYSGTFADGASGSGSLSVGDASNTGTVALSGTNTYSGDTTIKAGTLQALADHVFSSNSATTVQNGATLDLAGYAEQLKSLAGSGSITLGSGTLTTGTTGTLSKTFSGTISGTGGLTKQGTDSLTLSGVNSYTGDTKIGGGSLQISINASIASGTTTVDSGAKLLNNGSIAGTTTLNGTLAGNEGTFNTLKINGGSGLIWDISSLTGTAGTGWDVLNTTNLDLSGLSSSGKLTIYIYGGTGDGNGNANYTFNFLGSTNTITGFDMSRFSIDTSNFVPLVNGTWSIGTNSISGGGESLSLIYAVPEPSTYALFGLGALTFLIVARRKKA